MGLFDKMKASVGMDSATLEVDVQQRPAKRGDVLKAVAHVKGGKRAQKMRYLRVSIGYDGKWQVATADGQTVQIEGKGRFWYGDWPGTKDVVIEPNATLTYPIELRVPTDSPLSGADLKYLFFVRADIDEAKDPEFTIHFDVKE